MALDDDVTLGELGRMLVDLKADVRLLRGEYLRVDVYTAQRAQEDIRFRAIETAVAAMAEARTATTRLVYGAFITAVCGFLLQVLLAAVRT